MAFQTRFIIHGIYILKNVLPNDKIWIIDNEVLLKQVDNELSAFVVTKEGEEADAQEVAKKKIEPYIRLCSVLVHKNLTIKDSGTRPIHSLQDVGKPPYSVVASRAIGTEIGLPRGFLRVSKKLNLDIMELDRKFLFLNTASLFYYNASKYLFDEVELGKFNSRKFINATISMESLFNDAASDIAYILSIRTAATLECIGYNSVQVFTSMKNLYKLRNDIVHGIAKKKPSNEDTNRILDYAKDALICCYILSFNRKEQSATKLKTNLIEEIDEMLLNSSKRRAIKREISKGINKFMLTKWKKIVSSKPD